jgi:AhpD family alkylhydroperoxidase
MSKHVHYVIPIASPKATGLVAQVYTQMKQDLGIVPEPFTLHSPAPDLLAGAWAIFRESLLVGRVRRGVKEAVATIVSQANQCPWCVDAHTISLYATGDAAVARAIMHHEYDTVADQEMKAILHWAIATPTPKALGLRTAPFGVEEAPEMIGTAVVFQYLNRMVNAVLSETTLPRSPWMKHLVQRTFGWFYARAIRKPLTPGKSLALLPNASLPPDLVWAERAPHVAEAFARFAAVVEQAGATYLPREVRGLVKEHIQIWHGENPGLSRIWVEQAVNRLDETERPAGRLALLTALAPYQLDEGVIHAFRAKQPEDAALVGALAWSSLLAARRVSAWLWDSTTPDNPSGLVQ